MSPQEQAQAIVQLCTRRHGDFHYWNGDCRAPAIKELVDGIATALAASAAKVDHCEVCWTTSWEPIESEEDCEFADHPHEGDHIRCGMCWLARRHIALTAKLEASEREVESWKIMADNMRVRSEASERARKQVTEYAMRTVTLTGWDDDGATTPIDPRLSWESVARLALDYAMAALASPEARATGEGKAACYDCGLPYDDPGFCDLVVPPTIWEQISPNREHPEGGLLCPTCLCRALVKAGVQQTAGRFTSGPLAMPSAEDQA